MGLADFGLMARGDTEFQRDQADIVARNQENTVRGQQIETGAIGLADIQRQDQNQQAYRDTASSSQAAGMTLGGSLMEMAKAAAAKGDMDSANRFQQGYDQMNAAGASRFVHAIMTNPTPGDRSDLVDLMNSNEATKGVQNVSLDDRGNYTVTKRDGSVMPAQSVGHVAELMGLIKPPRTKLGPNEKLVDDVSGRDVATNPISDFEMSRDSGIMFDKRSGQWKDIGGGEWKLGTVLIGNNEQTVELNSRTGESRLLGRDGARTGLEAKVNTDAQGNTFIALPGGKVAKFTPATPGTPEKTNWFSPNTPGTPATDESVKVLPVNDPGRQTALIAEQIRMANPNLPTDTLNDMATTGKVMRGNQTGKLWLFYQGQKFPMAEPQGTPVAQPAPRTANPPATTPSGSPGATAPAAGPAASRDMQPVDKFARYGDINDRIQSLTVNRERNARSEQAVAAFDKMIADLRAEKKSLNITDAQYQQYQSDRQMSAMQAQYETAKRMFGEQSNQALNLKAQIDKMSQQPGAQAPSASQTPQSAGLEPEGGTPVSRTALFGNGGNKVNDLLKRGAAFEAEDPNLRSAGRLLRSITSSGGTVRNPSILNGAIADYQARLQRLEAIRGPAAATPSRFAAGGLVANHAPWRSQPSDKRERYTHDPN